MSADREEARGLARGIVGSARVTAFGTSIVAPAASVVTVLVIMMSYAGFASPLVVLITFAGSLCCALSIAEFARRVPSAGWAYTYNSRGLGQTAGFLTGWMMIFGYALFVPAGIALTSMYASRLLSDDVFHATVSPSVLFVVIVAAVALVTYLGIGTSASVDLLLVAGEMAVIAALAITILVKIGPAHYSLAVFSPASSPHGQLTEITNAMIYGITAFAGFEAAAALGEEARDTRRSVPASIIGIVIVTGIFYLLVILAETFDAGRDGIPRFIAEPSPLGDLTSRYWSPSALWVIDLVVVLPGLGFVIAASNAAIRILFAMAREQALPGIADQAVPPPYSRRRDRVPGGDHPAARPPADLRLRRSAPSATSPERAGSRWCSSTCPGTSRLSARSAPSSATSSASGGICSSRPRPW